MRSRNQKSKPRLAKPPSKSSSGIPGINIQWPWSQLIISGKKTIETRAYPLPENKKNIPIALIETPGPRGRQEGGIKNARIIGVIKFTKCVKYSSLSGWRKDFTKHRVPSDDPDYQLSPGEVRYGWVTKVIKEFSKPKEAPQKKGIVWATNCSF
jgi:hypothetical protein